MEEEGKEAAEDEELEGDLDEGEDVVEQSGAKKAADKPVGKRDMSDRYYLAAAMDLANPHCAGFYGTELPAGKKRAQREARQKKSAVRNRLNRSSFIPEHRK